MRTSSLDTLVLWWLVLACCCVTSMALMRSQLPTRSLSNGAPLMLQQQRMIGGALVGGSGSGSRHSSWVELSSSGRRSSNTALFLATGGKVKGVSVAVKGKVSQSLKLRFNCYLTTPP
jgi:hypothetical protein